jgi:3-deoxy-7-phosphoheptulonate synthase
MSIFAPIKTTQIFINMLIVMKSNATAPEIDAVVANIETIGMRAHPLPGATRTAIGITGNTGVIDGRRFENLAGVAEVIRVSKPYKLITLDLRPEKTIVRVGDATIGGGELAIIAGPCAIENRDQAFAVAEAVHQSGARFFRGGVWKPRTSPYSFRGLGEKAWGIMAEIRETFGLKIVTEALDEAGIGVIEQYGDVIQIGARNMQNFPLLERAGRSKLPVLLKRGMAATLEEWLLAAEYIMGEGNYNVILCERGVRTFAQHTRNTLDLAAVPAIRRISHLPVIVDPSHGSGNTYMVTPLARAGVAVGADGLMVEVHDHPEIALSDGAQALTPSQYAQLVNEVRAIHKLTSPISDGAPVAQTVNA